MGKPAMVQLTQQQRRKGIGTRVWLVVAESGQSHSEEVGKHAIMRRTGLPARDLRALDPMLSYPSSILGRERAIMVNLEHIKAIITAKEVLMINSNNPLVVQFVQDLQDRISNSNKVTTNEDIIDMEDSIEATCGSTSLNSSTVMSQKLNAYTNMKNSEWISSKRIIEVPVASSPKLFPFEFKALEVCLESACKCLESETQTLEEEAYPALDELTSKISTLNLERVRQIKSRLVAISGRVHKVRDELEHLLDDENDMVEMYLTEKLDGHSVDQSAFRDELVNEASEVEDDRIDGSNSEQNSEISTNLKPNVEELEMLLEAYFAQIDGILQKLANMKEYVDDTEDCINIMLDDKQNQLLQMGVMLSTANMILNAGIVVVGLFGMNITISLFSAANIKFWETTLGTVGGCIALYLIAVGWGRKRSLI